MFALTLNGVDHINRLDNYNGDEVEFRSTEPELVVQLPCYRKEKEMLIAEQWRAATPADDDGASCDNERTRR